MNKGLYRGKIKGQQTGHYELDWAFGNRVDELSTGKVFICDLSHFDDKTLLKDVLIEVLPETVGQFTGLTDKNGKKIFEGDILHVNYHSDDDVQVFYADGHFGWKYIHSNFIEDAGAERCVCFRQQAACGYRIIGNIYDNPELLGEKAASV